MTRRARRSIERDSLVSQAERESLMTPAKAELLKSKQGLIESGFDVGYELGLKLGRRAMRSFLLTIHEHRLGAAPEQARDGLRRVSDLAALQSLLPLFLDGSAEEIAGHLQARGATALLC